MNIEIAFLCTLFGILGILIGFPVAIIVIKTTEPLMWAIAIGIASPWSYYVYKSNLRRN